MSSFCARSANVTARRALMKWNALVLRINPLGTTLNDVMMQISGLVHKCLRKHNMIIIVQLIIEIKNDINIHSLALGQRVIAHPPFHRLLPFVRIEF